MANEALIMPRAVLLISILVILPLACMGCSDQPNHIAVGSWSSDAARVVIFSDYVATVNNVRCSWVPSDYWSIRLELTEPQTGEPVVPVASEFRVLEGSEGNRAVLNLLWGDVTLERKNGTDPGTH